MPHNSLSYGVIVYKPAINVQFIREMKNREKKNTCRIFHKGFMLGLYTLHEKHNELDTLYRPSSGTHTMLIVRPLYKFDKDRDEVIIG